MRTVTEKVVASREPATVTINLHALPKHEKDALCRSIFRLTANVFDDPNAAAEFKKWQKERREKAARKEGHKCESCSAPLHGTT